jgi:hypothetical protein
MFLFLVNKIIPKRAALAAFALTTALMFVSCEQPPGTIPSINDEKILTYPDDAIFINSQADMANIGVVETHPLTGTYVLASDITLENWTPIGDAAKPFHGVFDGNRKTITLTSFADTAVAGRAYLGIFGYAKGMPSRKVKIKDLTIISSVDAVSNMATGQAVGLAAAYANLAEIDNITLSGNFTFKAEKTVYVGGVVGHINGNGTALKNCNSSMVMDIKPGFGSPLVTGMANSFSFVGGFAGLFTNAAGIENCHNTGAVSGIGDHIAASQVLAGGIAGGSFYGYSAVFQGYVQDSSSTGNIKVGARGSWPMAGGIAGVICGGNGTKENSTRIERCRASGTITVADVLEKTNTSQWPYLGGIVGYVYYGAWVSQCYFNGKVIVNRINDYCGGIAGYSSYATSASAERVCVIEDCWSAGEATGYNNAGGIVGQNQQNTILRRCYSLMDVSVTNNANGPNLSAQWGVGGIAGSHSSTKHPDAMLACVALNRSITSPRGDEIHRIAGRIQKVGGVMPKMTNNYALPGLIPVTDDPSKSYTADKGLIDKPDGEDIPNEYISNGKPTEAFYKLLGWDFVNAWKMGSDGYPKLQLTMSN